MPEIKIAIEIENGVLISVKQLNPKFDDPKISIVLRDLDNVKAGDIDPMASLDESNVLNLF